MYSTKIVKVQDKNILIRHLNLFSRHENIFSRLDNSSVLRITGFYVPREIVFIPRKENFFSLRINPRKTHHVSKDAT
jgi:hypothetical protein